jgi:hypothetical protein
LNLNKILCLFCFIYRHLYLDDTCIFKTIQAKKLNYIESNNETDKDTYITIRRSLMVASSGVLLSAWRGVRHIQIPPIAYVLQGHPVVVDAGAGGLVTLADVPLVANVTGRELSLLLLTGLAVLAS